jgi:hypothetical protein
MTGSAMTVNGHVLPRVLDDAIKSGRWAPPADLALLAAAFADQPVHPSFYDADQLRQENSTWVDETDVWYVGEPDRAHAPGDLDPRQSVLIGDLGPDRPFALDYRTAPTPRVVYLREIEGRSRWTEVAQSVDDLLTRLGIGP